MIKVILLKYGDRRYDSEVDDGVLPPLVKTGNGDLYALAAGVLTEEKPTYLLVPEVAIWNREGMKVNDRSN